MTVWQDRDLDQASADALAVITLYATGNRADLALAAELVDELTADPDGTGRLVGGLVSIAATLLALREWDIAASPEESLRTIGGIVASALLP